MGKKQKIGKQRQDKFYRLAKETGFRSRAAFKLIQLNRKFEFLQKSRVLIDLCAAPGGWLQVASQNMPVSSIIIGVDLVPIKPMPNVITLEEDITTDKCKQALRKHLKSWKADIVLHDGAPNVGKNWLHDAFQQAQLTMQALKLASSFLTKGGWFITKVFRSKDYHALIWAFKQFFRKVHATKPQASRTESAEIFVICQNYLAPDKIDPKLFDPKYVFEEVNPEPKTKLNLMFPEKEKRRAEGYPEGDTILYHKLNISQFVTSSNCIELLNSCNELIFDDDKYLNSKFTTNEIKECCKDIKVLGRKELKLLLSWRKKLKEEFHAVGKVKVVGKIENDPEEDEDTLIQRKVEEAQQEEMQELKRKKKKVLKERRKLHEKMNLKMILPNDEPIVSEDKSLFYLNLIKNKKDLKKVDEGNLKVFDTELEHEDDEEDLSQPNRIAYDRDTKNLSGLYSDESAGEDSDEEVSLESYGGDSEDEEEDESEEKQDNNPLLVDLDDDPVDLQKQKKMNLWFDKDIFSGIEKEADEKYEVDQITEYFKKKNSKVNKEVSKLTLLKDTPLQKENGEEERDATEKSSEKQETSNSTKKRKQMLDVEGLALGTLLIHSQKKKRDIIDDGWNRYTFGEENLPEWFKTDEDKHNKKQLPVSKEMVEEFKQKLKEINARPIKKIAEAKARKKRKTMKKLEKARKKAEAITGTNDLTEAEKRHQVKAIYKKLLPNKPKEVTYVVAKKGMAGRRARRPAGVKGPFKVVDPRMKKDNFRRRQEREKKRH